MADHTLGTTQNVARVIQKGWELIWALGLLEVVTIKAALTTAFPGMIVTFDSETNPDIDLAAAAESKMLLIEPVEKVATYDIDDAAVAEHFWYALPLPLPPGVHAWIMQIGNTAIVRGWPLMGIAGGVCDLFAYAEDAVETDTFFSVIGYALTEFTGHATEKRWVLARG